MKALDAVAPGNGVGPAIALAALYFVAARLAVSFTVVPEGLAILWPSNGILLAFLLHYRKQPLLLFLTAAAAAEIAADVAAFSVVEAVLFAAINIGEALAARALLFRWQFDARFRTAADLGKFLLAAPFISAGIAALAGGAVYAVFRGGETSYLELARTWWFGDAVGLVILTPSMVSFWQAADKHARAPLSIVDSLTAAAALLVVVLLVAATDGQLGGLHIGPIVLMPVAAVVGARRGVAAAAAASAGVAMVVTALTVAGRNPFGHATVEEAVIHAQEFIMVASVMTLGLATLVGDLQRRQEELLRASAELRARADTLQGLLPICAWCKRVRDDEHYWHAVEDYLARRTDSRLSHGICPECADKMRDEFS